MSSIFNYLFRVFITNLRSIFHQKSPSSDYAQPETSHYQHGIPGIPTDGKVVLLKNSSNAAQIYLVGTNHISKQSAETVKEVELCKKRAMGIMDWTPEDKISLYMLFRRSMRAAGGLCMKFVIFIQCCEERRLHANGIFPGLEFKVAIEESSRVGARCFYIDQDMDVTLQQLCKVSSFYWRWDAYRTRVRDEAKCTRSFVQETHSFQKKLSPEFVSFSGDSWSFPEIHS